MTTRSTDRPWRTVTQTTAESTSPETGSVPSSAPTPGSAEELGLAREVDGAVAMMAARAPHSHTRPQDWLLTAERSKIKRTLMHSEKSILNI